MVGWLVGWPNCFNSTQPYWWTSSKDPDAVSGSSVVLSSTHSFHTIHMFYLNSTWFCHVLHFIFSYCICSAMAASFTPAPSTAKRKEGKRERKYSAALGIGWAITTSFLFLFTVCMISLARTDGRMPWLICLAMTVEEQTPLAQFKNKVLTRTIWKRDIRKPLKDPQVSRLLGENLRELKDHLQRWAGRKSVYMYAYACIHTHTYNHTSSSFKSTFWFQWVQQALPGILS